MSPFTCLRNTEVLDADGRARRVYNLRAWWWSPGARAEVPAGLRASIRADAARRWEKRHGGTKGTRWRGVWKVCAVVAVTLFFFRKELSSGNLSWFSASVVAAVILVNAMILAPMIVIGAVGWLIGWMPRGSSAAVAGAMVGHGRCASCAHELDLTNEESTGVVRCPECGAAWRTAGVDMSA